MLHWALFSWPGKMCGFWKPAQLNRGCSSYSVSADSWRKAQPVCLTTQRYSQAYYSYTRPGNVFFQPIFQFSTNHFPMIFNQSLSMASITNFRPIAFPLQKTDKPPVNVQSVFFFSSICQELRFCGNQVAAIFRGKGWIEMSKSQLQK